MQSIYEHSKENVPRAQLYILNSVIEHITVELRWLNELHKDASAGRLSEIGMNVN